MKTIPSAPSHSLAARTFRRPHLASFSALRGTLALFLSWAAASAAATPQPELFLAAGNDSASAFVARWNPDTTAFDPLAYVGIAGGANSRAVAIADFNNDGLMDFVMGRGNGGETQTYLFLNNGSNMFRNVGIVASQSGAGSYAMDSTAADFNNDGNMDFTAQGNSGTLGVYLGNGNGTFRSLPRMELEWYGRGVDAADFNHDGNMDLVRATYSSGNVRVYPGLGDGTFGPNVLAGSIGSTDPYGCMAGDFDNDGNDDIIANTGGGGDPYFLKGNGNLTFQAPVYVPSLDIADYGALDAYDFNRDGNLDVVVTRYYSNDVLFYPGNGNGTFGASVRIGGTSGASMTVSAPPTPSPAGTPVAVITPGRQTAAVGSRITLDGSQSSDPNGTVVAHRWNFGKDAAAGWSEGAPSAGSYTYTNEGLYTAVLQVKDNNGWVGIASAMITVTGAPPSVSTEPVSYGEEAAAGGRWPLTLDAMTFAQDDGPIVDFQWDLDDGFEDTFEDGDAKGWPIAQGAWSIETNSAIHGVYSFRQSSLADRTWILHQKEYAGDISVAVDVRILGGSGQEVILLLHAQNPAYQYEIIYRGRGINDLLMRRISDGGYTDIANVALPNGLLPNQTYHLEVRSTGPMISAFINGQLLASANDTTYRSGRAGLCTYATDAVFDNFTVRTTAFGNPVTHAFTPGAHNVSLSVMDSVGQRATGIVQLQMQPGLPPVADAGGPYSVDESTGNAQAGVFTVPLNATASTDTVTTATALQYQWDLGAYGFNNGTMTPPDWGWTRYTTGSGQTLQLDGQGWYNPAYCVTHTELARGPGAAATFKLMVQSGEAAVALRLPGNGNSYYNTTYGFRLYGSTIYVFEDGSYRGSCGWTFATGAWYEFKVELKEFAGYRLFFRSAGAAEWNLLWDSNYGNNASYSCNVGAEYGTTLLDSIHLFMPGATPQAPFYGTGSHPVTLSVTDRAGSSTSDSTTVQTLANDPPTALLSQHSYTLAETNALNRQWDVSFSAEESGDDFGICRYEWDWNYDARQGFRPAADDTPTATHTWYNPGVYTVAVRITDNALQTAIDTATVTIVRGAAPTANAGGPYTVDEVTGAARNGSWKVQLNGSASRDPETRIIQYFWDLGTDTFAGTTPNTDNWQIGPAGAVQNDLLQLTGPYYWGYSYAYSRTPVDRSGGTSFEGRIRNTEWGYAMVGFQEVNETFYYSMPYAIYFSWGSLYIYESGNQIASVGSYELNTWYDFRIELNDDSGARYYLRPTGTTEWTLLFNSNGSSSPTLTRGIDCDYGTFQLDDINLFATGSNPVCRISGKGVHPVTLTVWDEGGNIGMTTTTITTVGNGLPTANAGPDQIVSEDTARDGVWRIDFSAAGSTDDHGISRYEWDFNYNVNNGFVPSGIEGMTVRRPFSTQDAGTRIIAVRVSDHALQSAIDTAKLTILLGDAPTAVAGGPYTAGAGGPPAYFDGRNSFDLGTNGVPQPVTKYFWDVNINVDSDGNGNPADDVDRTGMQPFYVYPLAGVYTAKLTVTDRSGQTASDTALVTVASNLPPNVICVPVHGNPSASHLTYNGREITLKAIVRDAGALTYQWDFGDGSELFPAVPEAVENKLAIEAKHTYTGSSGKPFIARLTVWDSAGLSSSDSYPIVVRPDILATRSEIAVDEGLWWLHKDQNHGSGAWISGYSYESPASAASALHAFEINGHRVVGNPKEDPYVETVRRGFDFLFTRMAVANIGMQENGNPDSNGNGIGVDVNDGDQPYQLGMLMDALASSQSPMEIAATGPEGVKFRHYIDILTDMADMYAWGQVDSGYSRGGWRYSWNSSADNSACQWGAIGLHAAHDTFGIEIPLFVRTNNLAWLQTSFTGSTYGYDSTSIAWSWFSTTPSAMVQLSMDGVTTTNTLWRAAEDWIAANWPLAGAGSTLYYSDYAVVKAMRLAQPNPVVTFASTGLDWYNDPVVGIRQKYVTQQQADGSWYGYANTGNSYALGGTLSTSWALVILTPSLFMQPPVAIITAPMVWGYDEELHLDASTSYHVDMSREIVLYQWDFNNDGAFDLSTTNAADPQAKLIVHDPHPGTRGDLPTNVTVRLRVTDNNDPAQSDETSLTIVIAEPPHAPYAKVGGPYQGTTGIPVQFNGSGSFDIDPFDRITRYEWDFNNDAVPDLVTNQPLAKFTFTTAGEHFVALRVMDNGILNEGVRLYSEWDFSRAMITANLPPVADAGGPYQVNEDVPLVLDGSASHDPNGNPLTYAWDFNGDRITDATAAQPTNLWAEPGVYPVTLTVSDSALQHTDSTTVTVSIVYLLTGVTLDGPAQVVEGSNVVFTCAADFTHSRVLDVSTSAVWVVTSANPPAGTHFEGNRLVAGDVTVDTSITIQAKYTDNGITRSASRTVIIRSLGPTFESLSITGPTQIPSGGTGTYACTARLSDGTTANISSLVVWQTVGPVPAGTRFTGNVLQAGTVTASSNIVIGTSYTYKGVTRSAEFTVTIMKPDAVLQSIAIDGPAQVNSGATAAYTCTAVFSDQTTLDLSTSVVWRTQGAVPSGTRFTANLLQAGTANKDTNIVIWTSYTYKGVTRTDNATVTILKAPATLAAVALAGPAQIPPEETAAYTCTAQFSDNTTADVSTSAVWETVGTVPAGTRFNGNVLQAGATSVDTNILIRASFTYRDVTRSATRTVTLLKPTVPLDHIAISGPTQVRSETTAPYMCVAYFTDGSTAEVSTSTVWQTVGSVPPGTHFDTMLLYAGTTDAPTNIAIRATYTQRAVTRSVDYAVTILKRPPVLNSITVNGPTLVPQGGTASYTCIANFSDGTSSNVSALARWQLFGAAPSGTTLKSGTLRIGRATAEYSVLVGSAYTFKGVQRVAGRSVSISSQPVYFLVWGAPAQNGTPAPQGYGLHTLTKGTVVTNTVAATVPAGEGIRQACMGWTGRGGDVPQQGQTNLVVFTLTKPSMVTWLWRTEYALTLSASEGGTVAPTSAWMPKDAPVSLTASAYPGFVFSHWSGDVTTGTATNNPLSLTMNQPRTVRAVFEPFSGSVTVSIYPPDVNDAGARWRFTSGIETNWHRSDEVVSGLPADGAPYTILFTETNPWWLTPMPVTVAQLTPGEVLRLAVPYLPVNLNMVWVPGGTYRMGAIDGNGGVNVTIPDLWMDVREVTVGEYMQYCAATETPMPEPPPWGWTDTNLPVVNVTRQEAENYAAWVGKRLPTEAEFEYAMRSSFENRRYPWGNSVSPADANFGDPHGMPTAAGTYPPAGYGLLDIAGNTWEWCAPETTNTPGVVRGGSWASPSVTLQCIARFTLDPNAHYADLGFRCVRDWQQEQ